LRTNELQINKELRQYLIESTKSRRQLYKDYKELGRLLKPHGLIMKPIFCVMVLKHTLPPQPADFNWNDRDELKKVWLVERKQLRSGNFLAGLIDFDISTVSDEDYTLVKKILNDPWMQDEMRTRHLGIAQESYFCYQMWKWANKILEFFDVAKELASYGISEIEDKCTRAELLQTSIRNLLSLDERKVFVKARSDSKIASEILELSSEQH